MKNLDPKYLAEREGRKAQSMETEFKKPGSVILLSTCASGFSAYAVGAGLLIAYDVLIKMMF